MKKIIKIIFILFINFAYSNQLSSFNITNMHQDFKNLFLLLKNKYKFSAIEFNLLSQNESLLNISIYNGNISKDSSKIINENNIFQVGSITKTFTVQAILELVIEKKLKLTDNVGMFLPEYPLWNNITILELINQTSGIFDYCDSFLWWQRLYLFSFSKWTPKELLSIAYGKEYFPSSTSWHYSNTNYVILGLIIEKVSKKNVNNFFNKYFFKKLHLNNSYYVIDKLTPNLEEKIVSGYHNNYDMTKINPSWLQTAGAILSDVNNMNKWYLYYANKIYHNQEFINKFIKIDKDMFYNSQSSFYGFAIFSINTPYGLVWYTPGLTLGYTSLAVYLPNKNIAFTYIISNSFKNQNIHKYILLNILALLSKYYKG